MKRVYISFCVVACIAAVACAAFFAMDDIIDEMDTRIAQIKISAEAENYVEAAQKAAEYKTYFDKKEHLMVVFLQREYIISTGALLISLISYAENEQKEDLLCTIDLLEGAGKTIRHVFFDVL